MNLLSNLYTVIQSLERDTTVREQLTAIYTKATSTQSLLVSDIAAVYSLTRTLDTSRTAVIDTMTRAALHLIDLNSEDIY